MASNTIGKTAPNYKTTWNESFKWKPVEHNTVDFLVIFKKNKDNSIFIGNRINTGINLTTTDQNTYFYTLILNVGFDEKKHGYINPCLDIINDNLKKYNDYSNLEYKPVQFLPTNPYDDNAGITNVMRILIKIIHIKYILLKMN